MIRKQPLFTRARPVAAPRRPSVLRRLLGWVGRGLRRVSVVIGALVLISVAVNAVAFVVASGREPEELPDQFILTLKLDDGLPDESGPAGGLIPREFLPKVVTVHDMIDRIERAAADDRVKALAVWIDGGDFPMPAVQELRAAIADFRKTGRPAMVFSPSFADAAPNFTAYYLASAFDEIWMQPVGMIFLTGIDAETPYMRSALEKIGIKGAYFQRKEYKNAFENITSDTMSAASAEMTSSMLADIMDQLLDDIAADRKQTPGAVMNAIHMGVVTDTESVSLGLVDTIGFSDQMMKALRDRLGAGDDESIPSVDLADYTPDKKDRKNADKPTIAMVSVSNMIMPGTGDSGGLFGDKIAGADDIAADIRKAARTDDIAAIVLRINSPGGSPSASETIRHATAYAREKGKPVIVSMGSVAGSGGYWIATDADHIFAMPTTLTGSIGVVAGKFDLSGLWTKLGVNWDGVSVGQNAGMWSFNNGFDASGTDRMNAMTDRIYDLFITRVAEGRGMSPDAVEAVARGRVWTGRQAHKVGLVDSLGGLNDALDYAAAKAGAKDRHGVRVVTLPDERGPLHRILKEIGLAVRMPEPVAGLLNQVRAEALPGGVRVYDSGLEGW